MISPSLRLVYTAFVLILLTQAQAEAKSVLVPTDNPATVPNHLLPLLGPTSTEDQGNCAEADQSIGSTASTKLKCADESSSTEKQNTQTMTDEQERNMALSLINKSIKNNKRVQTTAYQAALEEQKQKEAKFKEVMKPKIMDDISFNDDPDYLESDWKYSILVKLEPEFYWGKQDVSKIKAVFGYEPKDIQANCQLRFDASAISDLSRGSTATIYAGEEKKLRYSDVLKSVRFQPRAVCKKPRGPLGNTGDILRVTGDNYVLLLLSAPSCSPTDMPGAISVTYLGDGKVKCK